MIAIYARQSVDKKDSISIETQINFCIRNIDSNDSYKVYIDKGYSGGNINRPDFERMVGDFENGVYTKLIVYKVDRISRSILDFADIMEILDRYKVRFASATETFDTSTPIGRAMLNIIMVFAQLERETIQSRITDNYYSRLKKGYYHGGPPPYGFKKIRTRIEEHRTSMYAPDDETLPHLLKMYELYLENTSLGDIVKYLNENEIMAPKGGNWESSKISKTLHNPAYVKANADVYTYYKKKGVDITNELSEFTGEKGCFLYGKRKANERKYTNVKDHTLSLGLHNGVIEAGPWLLCQEKLDSNVQIKNNGKGKYTWLSGIIKCGNCGYSLVVVNSNQRYLKFYCSGYRSYNACCDSKGKNVEEIEEIVKHMIFERIQSISNTICDIEETDTAVVNNLKLKIIGIENQIDHIVDQICLSGETLTELLNKQVDRLVEERNLLQDELEKETSAVKTAYYDDLMKCIDHWDERTIEQKKILVRDLIKTVTVKESEINIEWKV